MLSVIIPCHNEAFTLNLSMGSLVHMLGESPHEIVCVDDGSTDATAAMIQLCHSVWSQVRLVKYPFQVGYGYAVKVGLASAKGDYVVVMMADGSDDPTVLREMLRQISYGYDLVVGSRYMKGGRQIGGPLVKRTLSRLCGLALYWCGLPVHDATNAFKMMRASKLRELDLESEGFDLNLEITAKAYRAGWRIAEVPVTWRDRRGGRSKFSLVRELPRYVRWFAFALGAPSERNVQGE